MGPASTVETLSTSLPCSSAATEATTSSRRRRQDDDILAARLGVGHGAELRAESFASGQRHSAPPPAPDGRARTAGGHPASQPQPARHVRPSPGHARLWVVRPPGMHTGSGKTTAKEARAGIETEGLRSYYGEGQGTP